MHFIEKHDKEYINNLKILITSLAILSSFLSLEDDKPIDEIFYIFLLVRAFLLIFSIDYDWPIEMGATFTVAISVLFIIFKLHYTPSFHH